MTLKTFKEHIDQFLAEHPDLYGQDIVCDGGWLHIGKYNREEREWELGMLVTCLPKDTGAKYND